MIDLKNVVEEALSSVEKVDSVFCLLEEGDKCTATIAGNPKNILNLMVNAMENNEQLAQLVKGSVELYNIVHSSGLKSDFRSDFGLN